MTPITTKTAIQFNKMFERMKYEDDILEDGYYEDRPVVIWRNSARCILALWFQDNGEYVSY